jgi:hypothetical protein
MRSPFDSQWVRSLLARHWGKLLVLQAAVLVGLGYVLASLVGGTGEAEPAMPVSAAEVTQTSVGPSMWTCSMHPQIRQPNPGKCPICGMDLIPVAKTSGGLRTLSVSPEARALMDIETSPVERKYVMHEVRMVGKVDYDETKLGYITAWVSGRLDRLYVDYTGVEVREGDHMVYIYSEDLYSAQQELIQAVRYAGQRGRSSDVAGVNLVEAAREKLRLLGLMEKQIKEIEKQDSLCPGDRHCHRETQAGRRTRTAGGPNLHDRRSEPCVGALGRVRIGPALDSLRPGRHGHDRSLSGRGIPRADRFHPARTQR